MWHEKVEMLRDCEVLKMMEMMAGKEDRVC